MFNNSAQINILNKTNLVLLLAILLYGFGYLFIGAFYSVPNAEDLSLSANAKNHGLLFSVIEVLVNYDGRYFTNILQALSPLAFGCISCYKYITVFSIVLPIFCLSFFLSSIASHINKIQIFFLSALFVLINYAISPSIVHQIYWMSSSFVYHYSWCFYLLWTGSFIQVLKAKNSSSKFRWFLLSTLLLVCSMGMNEMFLVINGVSLMAFSFYVWEYAKTDFAFLWPLLASAALSIVFFLSNPGILKRIHSLETQQSGIRPLDSLAKTVSHFSQELLSYFVYLPFLLPLSLLFILFFFKELQLKMKFSFYFLLFPFVMLPFALLTFYMPMGFETSIPFRIYTTIYFGFLLYSTILVPLYFHSKISSVLQSKKQKFQNYLILVCLLILSASFFMINNNISLLKADFHSGKMKNLDAVSKVRYALIKDSKNNIDTCWKEATIPALSDTPKSIYHQPDLKANRTEPYWNQAFEKYFLINEVRLSGDTLSLLKTLQSQKIL